MALALIFQSTIPDLTGKPRQPIEIDVATAQRMLTINGWNPLSAILAIEKLLTSGKRGYSHAIVGTPSWQEEQDGPLERRVWWTERKRKDGKVVLGWIRRNTYEEQNTEE